MAEHVWTGIIPGRWCRVCGLLERPRDGSSVPESCGETPVKAEPVEAVEPEPEPEETAESDDDDAPRRQKRGGRNRMERGGRNRKR